MYFVYIIKSLKTGKHYIGYTRDFKKRLAYHNKGLNVSTRGKGPWILVYKECFETKREALRRERFLKRQRNKSFYDRLITGCGVVG